ncbi:MAG TPA: phospholipase D-like domain-containing protein, partial [Treponemataceae bacterium]|nr:phospholipase D-like domain-containing protein [Treponemataceae bacterium]
VIKDIKQYYNMEWNHTYSVPYIRNVKPKNLKQENKNKDTLKNGYYTFKKENRENIESIDWNRTTIQPKNIQFVHNPIGRKNQDPWCLKKILKLASNSNDSIFLQSPYVIPSRHMKSEFDKYDINLNNVSILTNSLASSPNIPAVSGYLHKRNNIIKSGARIYEYQGPQSIHSKTYVFDNHISVIGSFNLDARSSFLSTESMVVITSEKFAKIVHKNIQNDLDNSLQLDKNYRYIKSKKVTEGSVSRFKKRITQIMGKLVLPFDFLL